MLPLPSPSQASFIAGLVAAFVGTCATTSPTNQKKQAEKQNKSREDVVSSMGLTTNTGARLAVSPLLLLTIHTATLAYWGPNMNAIPRWLLGYGAANSLDGSLISWSAATALPMVMILGVGVPLRLAAYSGLGTDFTFALTRPDQLVTTGLYGLVQHPSYTGLACLMIGNTLLLCRADGALACWVPPAWYGTVRAVWTLAMPLGLGAALCVMWMRVRQEERMLRTEFGKKWERWHATTARFIPGLF